LAAQFLFTSFSKISWHNPFNEVVHQKRRF
jgi:hypothetical protein